MGLNTPITKKRFTWFFIFFIIAFLLARPEDTRAGKGHEECSICHGVHTSKGLRLFPKEFNTKIINPHTSKPLEKIDAFCMSCHASKPDGEGIRALDLTKKHCFGEKPKFVNLPESTKGFKGAKDLLTCLTCHDPHPSNRNYRYLRTRKGKKVSKRKDIKAFCLWCHPKLKSLLKKMF